MAPVGAMGTAAGAARCALASARGPAARPLNRPRGHHRARQPHPRAGSKLPSLAQAAWPIGLSSRRVQAGLMITWRHHRKLLLGEAEGLVKPRRTLGLRSLPFAECRDGSLLFQFREMGPDESGTVFTYSAAELQGAGDAALGRAGAAVTTAVAALGAGGGSAPAVPRGARAAHVHFIGMGGAGLSVLANLALKQGSAVSGSDMADSAKLRALREAGASVFVGQTADNLEAALAAQEAGLEVAVVVSSAVPATNPELAAAKAAGLSVFKRDTWLAALTADTQLLAVAGTHGKTSTSAMLATALRDGAGDDPSAVVGADVVQFPDGGGALCGSSARFVLEADEYDGAFLQLRPTVALILNVEWEHVDLYKSEAEIRKAFAAFAGGVRAGGLLLLCGDDAGARTMAEHAPTSVHTVTYGLDPMNDWSASMLTPNPEGGTDFVVVRGGMPLGRVMLPVPGVHNVLNALGCIAATAILDASGALASAESSASLDLAAVEEAALAPAVARAAGALTGFQGIARRFQKLAATDLFHLYDDYAHHPTEVRATLQAARQRYDTAKIWVVFQPHTYSRVTQFFDDFIPAFSGADRVLVTEVFAAREAPPGGGEELSTKLADSLIGPVGTFMPLGDAVERIFWELKAAEGMGVEEPVIIISMGAGDITQLGERLLSRLRGEIQILD